MLEKPKKKSARKSGSCRVVTTPSGPRYLKNGKFVKKSRC